MSNLNQIPNLNQMVIIGLPVDFTEDPERFFAQGAGYPPTCCFFVSGSNAWFCNFATKHAATRTAESFNGSLVLGKWEVKAGVVA